jgi:hypothetical protein
MELIERRSAGGKRDDTEYRLLIVGRYCVMIAEKRAGTLQRLRRLNRYGRHVFASQQLLDDAAHVYARAVGDDVDQGILADFAQARLL